MEEFTPSPDFVEDTMAVIESIEEKSPWLLWRSSMRTIAGYAGAGGAVLIGLVNLLRLLTAMYAPVICH